MKKRIIALTLIFVLAFSTNVFASMGLTWEEWGLMQQAIADGAYVDNHDMESLENLTALLWPNCIDPKTGKKWGEIKGTFNSPYIASTDSGYEKSKNRISAVDATTQTAPAETDALTQQALLNQLLLNQMLLQQQQEQKQVLP